MKNLNVGLTIPSLILVLFLLAISSFYPEQSQVISMQAMRWVTGWFGWLVQLISLALVGFLLWLAWSKHGDVRFGEEKPAYSNFSYACMIFSAGVGSSLIYWGIGEPMYYLQHPPMFAEANSFTAAAWAVTYPIFHWGVTGWAIYCFPAIPFAYAFYVKKKQTLKVSTLCEPVIGNNPIVAKCIDLLAIFGTLAGFSSGLSLTVNLISAGISNVFAIENSLTLQLGIIFFSVIVLFIVMLIGFSKGINAIANYTIIAAFIYALFVLAVSNSQFILNNFTDSFGVMLDSFFRMSLWTDPVQQSGFPQSWTQYYWLWYYAYLVMMGLFITRISRGRTIRELILYSISMGTLGCAFFISIFGGYAVWSQLLGGVPVQDWIDEHGVTFAVVSLIRLLLGKDIALVIFLVIQFFLMLTTMSSATVATSMLATNRLSLNGDPSNKIKLLWAGVIAIICTSVFLMGGSIEIIKSLCVVAGLPMMFIFVILAKQLMMELTKNSEYKANEINLKQEEIEILIV